MCCIRIQNICRNAILIVPIYKFNYLHIFKCWLFNHLTYIYLNREIILANAIYALVAIYYIRLRPIVFILIFSLVFRVFLHNECHITCKTTGLAEWKFTFIENGAVSKISVGLRCPKQTNGKDQLVWKLRQEQRKSPWPERDER